MSSKIKVDTIENVAGSGNVSLGSGHNLVVPGNITGQGTLGVTGASTLTGALTANGGATVLGNTIVNPDTAGKSTFQFTTQAANDAKLIMKSDTTDKITIHANGTTSFNGGAVTIPSQPTFAVHSNDNTWTTVSSGSNTIIPFNQVQWNIGSHFKTDAGTGQNQRFIAPVAGKYIFHLKSYVRLETSDDDGNHAYTRIRVNGGQYLNYYNIFGYQNHGDADQNADLTAVCDLSANDYVHCDLSAASGSASFYNGACVFWGYLIG